MIRKIVFILMMLLFVNIAIAEIKISNGEDVACMIIMLKEELSHSNNKELKEMSVVCQKFLDEYYAYQAHIRVFPVGYKKDNVGLFQPHQKAIFIRRNISEKALKVTLVHELTHYKQYMNNPAEMKHLSAFGYGNNSKGVVLKEVEAHKNAMLYYHEFTKETRENVPGWEKMLKGFSDAYSLGTESEFLSQYYQ